MFLLDWLTSLLRLLGLSSKKARIVILGLTLALGIAQSARCLIFLVSKRCCAKALEQVQAKGAHVYVPRVVTEGSRT